MPQSTVPQSARSLVGYAVVAWLLIASQDAYAADQDLLLSKGERLVANAIAEYDSSEAPRSARFTIDNEPAEVEGFVLWGAPRERVRRPGVGLHDGSWLFSDRTWSPTGLVRINDKQIKLRRGKGWVEFDRGSVEWVFLDAETTRVSPDQLNKAKREESNLDKDLVLLTSGDVFAGQLTELSGDKVTIDVAGNPIETTLEQVAALRLKSSQANNKEPACLIGFTDGSLLHANRLRVAQGEYTLDAVGTTITGKATTLALIQPLDSGVRYLSDLEPVDYQHTPYLDLTWPYAEDKALRGGQLAGGGRRAAKGIAMHSAARLIYRLDGSSQRFQAELAVAEQPSNSTAAGSVIFRVYLVKEGQFQSAYESEIIRGSSPMVPIDLDATGAAAIALVIDYADNGDAGDDALWMNARLIQQP